MDISRRRIAALFILTNAIYISLLIGCHIRHQKIHFAKHPIFDTSKSPVSIIPTHHMSCLPGEIMTGISPEGNSWCYTPPTIKDFPLKPVDGQTHSVNGQEFIFLKYQNAWYSEIFPPIIVPKKAGKNSLSRE